MYVPYFIAKRLRKAHKKAFTTIVHKIGMISVALGLATTLVASLIMKGFQQTIEHKITNFSGHLQVTKYSLDRSYEAPPLERSKLEGLKQVFPAYIQHVKAFAHKAVLLRAAEDVEGIVCKGLDPQAMHENLRTYLTSGQLLRFEQQAYSHDILLSNKTADRLNVQVGDEVMVCVLQQPPRYRKLKIAGLYTTNIADLDNKIAFCDLRLIQRLNNWTESMVGGYEVFLNNLHQTKDMVDKLEDWLDYDLDIQTTESEYAAIFDWLVIVRKNALIFIVLILLVTSSNLASIVLIQMMERTSMIGILKALGASDRQIQHMMLWNNLYMIVQGMFWGNLIGLGFCTLQHYFKMLHLDPTYYYINYVPIVWDWSTILGLNTLNLVVVTLVLLISITLIVRLRPISAIQFR